MPTLPEVGAFRYDELVESSCRGAVARRGSNMGEISPLGLRLNNCDPSNSGRTTEEDKRVVACIGRAALCCCVGLAVSVADSFAIQPFTEEAAQRGVNYTAQFLASSIVGMAGGSHGACFSDLDGDGDPDLVLVGRSDGVVGVFENDGTGHFAERLNTGIPTLVKASSISAGDFDGDGDPDLFIPQIVYPSSLSLPHLLVRNEGNFQFVNVAAAAGIVPGGSATGSTWGDYDGDDLLDLYVGNYSWNGSPINNRLYHNLGDGTFEEVAVALGVNDPGGFAFQASFIDYDLDGDVDLYLVNDRGGIGNPPNPGNRLWRNNGDGTFEALPASAGMNVNMFSMGIAYGDFDRNGWTDFYVSNIDPNKLFLNTGNHTFSEQGLTWGITMNSVSWGVLFLDVDNDGWLDVHVCNTPLGPQGSHAPGFFECDGTPPCQNVTASIGLVMNSGSYGSAVADVDDDGDVDMIVVAPSAPAQLYINHAEAEPSNRWLKVRLKGAGLNQHAIGATIFATDSLGEQQQAVVAGESYKSQSELVRHFGVGSTQTISEVRVLWPGGAESTINGVPTNQTLIVCENPPSAAQSPLPANASADVPLDTGLIWQGAASEYQVYFGAASPPPLAATVTGTTWSPGALQPVRTYYWRVDSITPDCGLVNGPVWSFATMAGDAAPNTLHVTITVPTFADSLTVSATTVNLAGTADDETGVTGVSWANDAGGSGDCTTTNGWNTWFAAGIALQSGLNLITVTATDAHGNSATDQIAITQTVPDETPDPPTIAFTVPTDQPTWTTTNEAVDIAGTASPTTIEVSWTNDLGEGGLCEGTTSWARDGIGLHPGLNLITVTALDADGQSGSATLAVAHFDIVLPFIRIVEPTDDERIEVAGPAVTLGGTASDNIGVRHVTWSSSAGGSGMAAGTTNWSAANIELASGENVITVSAFDEAGNEARDTITVIARSEAAHGSGAPVSPSDEAGSHESRAVPDGPNDGGDSSTDQGSAARRPRRGACGLGVAVCLPLAFGAWLAPGRRRP